jgi:signal transduction histidine kinase
MRGRSNVAVDVAVDAGLAAALSGRSADIVQLAREALSNVARHARATHASLRLSQEGSTAVLTVEDDGVGFDPRAQSAGNGMRNMGERAAALGGELQLASRNGDGTKLSVSFPIRV